MSMYLPEQAMTPEEAAARFYALIGQQGAPALPQLGQGLDGDFMAQQAGGLNQYNQQNLQLQQALQNAAQQRVMATRQLQDAAPNMFRNLLNNFAGRGMARSSGYGQGVVNANNQIAQEQGGYDTGYQQVEQQVAQQGAGNQINFIDLLNQVAAQQAQRNAERAAAAAAQQAQLQAIAAPQATAAPAPTQGIGLVPTLGVQTSNKRVTDKIAGTAGSLASLF